MVSVCGGLFYLRLRLSTGNKDENEDEHQVFISVSCCNFVVFGRTTTKFISKFAEKFVENSHRVRGGVSARFSVRVRVIEN